MGEHKLREAGNGDGDKPKPISSHIVEVVHEVSANAVHVAEGIEAAYTRLAERAKIEDSLIVTVSQAMSTYTSSEGDGLVLIVLTAQRIGREDFERQQRIAQFGPGGPRR